MFKHNFQDLLNAFCTCGLNPEFTSCYLLYYPLFAVEKKPFPGNIKVLITNSQEKNNLILMQILLFGFCKKNHENHF